MVSTIIQHQIDQFLIKPMMEYFTDFDENQLPFWYEDFQGFQPSVLKETAIEARRTAKSRKFPTIGFVRALASQIAENPAKLLDDLETSQTFDKNYGQPSNGQICDCGRHHGVGSWSPAYRASVYAWFRKIEKQGASAGFQPSQREYLATYEAAHGQINPNR